MMETESRPQPTAFTFRLLGLPLACLCLLGQPPQLGAQAGRGVFVSVKDAGAKGDGITDDTAAIQSVYNTFCRNFVSTGLSGQVYWPAGFYKITSHLVQCGTVRTVGESSGMIAGAAIDWHGPDYDTPLILYAAFDSEVENLAIRTNGRARYGIHIVADNAINTTSSTPVNPGLATVIPASMSSIGVGTLLKIDSGANAELVYVTAGNSTRFTANFAKAHRGTWTIGHGFISAQDVISRVKVETGSAGSGIALGNILGFLGGTPGSSETSEITIDNTAISGSGEAGIVQLDGNNAGDMYVYNPRIGGGSFHYGIDFGKCNFSNLISGGNFENVSLADIRVGGGCSLTVSGIYSEPVGAAAFVLGTGTPGLPGNLTLIGNVVAPTANPTSTVIFGGHLTMIGNTFHSKGPVKIRIDSPLVSANSSQVESFGNFYEGAHDWAPFVDGGGSDALLPAYHNHQPVAVVSVNDIGGASWKKVPLNNYQTASRIASQSAAHVSETGILAAGDTDIAVAFRNHADNGDVPGLAKDASDIVFVGGAKGIGLNSPTQIGNGQLGVVRAPSQGTGTGPRAPGTVVGWVAVKVRGSTYFVPLMK